MSAHCTYFYQSRSNECSFLKVNLQKIEACSWTPIKRSGSLIHYSNKNWIRQWLYILQMNMHNEKKNLQITHCAAFIIFQSGWECRILTRTTHVVRCRTSCYCARLRLYLAHQQVGKDPTQPFCQPKILSTIKSNRVTQFFCSFFDPKHTL